MRQREIAKIFHPKEIIYQPMIEVTASTSAVQPEIEQNYRWNFLVNSLDGASFWFGMSFISSTVILPLYVSHFTNSPLLIGLIPFLSTAGYLVPQLFVANAVERAPRKKFFPVTLGFFLQRLPILLLAPAAYFLAAFYFNTTCLLAAQDAFLPGIVGCLGAVDQVQF